MKTISENIGGAQALSELDFTLQSCFDEQLTDKYMTFLQILRVLEAVQKPLYRPYAGIGRKPIQYLPFMRSMLAKSFFGVEKTSDMIIRLKNDPNLRLLCGFEKVPGKASFSRVFSFLESINITDETFDSLVTDYHKDTVVYHVCRDSTSIKSREKKPPKKKAKKVKYPLGRPKKGETRPYKRQRRSYILKQQVQEPVEKSLADIPTNCSYGCKKNSNGNVSFWHGYKLHLDVSDIGFPLSAIVSSASVSDCHAAIILEKMTEKKVRFCYSLMDSAYDAGVIRDFIESRGRVPIIYPRKRNNGTCPVLDPAKKERYKIRTTVERAYSYLKENLIPSKIYVKGHAKVSFVLMSAILCLAALKTIQHCIL